MGNLIDKEREENVELREVEQLFDKLAQLYLICSDDNSEKMMEFERIRLELIAHNNNNERHSKLAESKQSQDQETKIAELNELMTSKEEMINDLSTQLVQVKKDNLIIQFQYNNIINNGLFSLVQTFNSFLDKYDGYRDALFLRMANIDNEFQTTLQREAYATKLSNLFSYILFGIESVVTRTSCLARYTSIDKTPNEFVEAVCYITLSFTNGIYKHLMINS